MLGVSVAQARPPGQQRVDGVRCRSCTVQGGCEGRGQGHRAVGLIGRARLRPEESYAEVGEGEAGQGLRTVGVHGLSTARIQSS